MKRNCVALSASKKPVIQTTATHTSHKKGPAMKIHYIEEDTIVLHLGDLFLNLTFKEDEEGEEVDIELQNKRGDDLFVGTLLDDANMCITEANTVFLYEEVARKDMI
jgi:hypothetical protein